MSGERTLPPSRFRAALLLTALSALVVPWLSWKLPTLGEPGAWTVWWLSAVPLVLWHWQYRRRRRRFWLQHHVNPESRWYRLLQGGYLMLPWAVLRAALLSAALLAGLLASQLSLWLMVLTPLLTALTVHCTDQLFCSALNPRALSLFSENAGRWLAVACLILVHAVVSLYQPQTDYAGVDFSDAASQVLYGAAAGSEFVSVIQAADAAQTFLFNWSVQNLLGDSGNAWLVLAGWLSILFKGALFFLPAVEWSLLFLRWLPRGRAWT